MMPNPAYTIISQNEYLRMPWKNGLGETLEIRRYEDNKGLRFRISQACVVEDGLFSDFSGLQRTLVLLSGNGMVLKQDTLAQTHYLSKALDIAHFSGGEPTYATLNNGKIEDLNIMVRAADTVAKVSVIEASEKIEFPTDQSLLFSGAYLNENCEIEIDTKDRLQVASQSIIVFTSDVHFKAARGCGVMIRIWAKN